MPDFFPIGVEIDIAEPRILKDRLCVSAGGRPERQAWDTAASSATLYRDPLRRRVMLMPLPMSSSWRTTTTGSYARLAKTDYTLTTSAAWVENHRSVSGNIYLEGNGTNERVTTATSYDEDKPWFISVYVPGVESLGVQTVLECGWGTPGGADTISLRFRANGHVIVYKGTTEIGQSDLDYASASTDPLKGAVSLSTVNILLLPTRRYTPEGDSIGGELMVITDAGVAYVQQFAGLADTDPIVSAGAFWWQVPIGRPSVLLAPVKFETSGNLYGQLTTLRYAPESGRSFTGRAFYSAIGTATATYSLVDSAGSAFVANGSRDEARGKVALSGDGTSTVCIEAVDWVMGPVVADTDDSEKCDITEVIEDLEIFLDDKGVATCRFRARRGALVDAGVMGFIELADRPFRIFITNPADSSEIDIIRGTLSAPDWTPADGLGNGDLDILEFVGTDRHAETEFYQYGDTVADDGKLFTDALADVQTTAGFDSGDLVISTSTARVPQHSEIPLGNFSFLPERGSKLSEHHDELYDRFAANWWRGWVPTTGGYKYRAIAPDDLDTSAALTLFEAEADAIAAGLTANQAKLRTIFSITRPGNSPEANQVVVLGQDPATGRPILSQDNDSASQLPTTAPSSRPVTWRGRIHRVMEIDPSIGSQAEADYVQETLFSRIATQRYLADFSVYFLMLFSTGRPIWTGDVVRLVLAGGTNYEDYRIIGLPRAQFPKMVTPALLTAGERPWYTADYRGQRIAEGAL